MALPKVMGAGSSSSLAAARLELDREPELPEFDCCLRRASSACVCAASNGALGRSGQSSNSSPLASAEASVVAGREAEAEDAAESLSELLLLLLSSASPTTIIRADEPLRSAVDARTELLLLGVAAACTRLLL